MPKLNMVMIARNEQRCIQRALESIKPYVDELIVLDTGSTDDTISLAQKSGAQVFHFNWCDDFSKARNAALDHSDADWNLVLDADEYLVEGGEYLNNLKNAHPNFIGRISLDSGYGDPIQNQKVRNWLTRLLPSSIRFAGRVHEQPIHNLPIQNLPIHFYHDGYHTVQRDQKKGRNEVLLLTELSKYPDDPYLHFQLGKEKEVDNDFIYATQSYSRCLELIGSRFDDWHRDLVIRTLFCMKKTQDFEKALILAEKWKSILDEIPDYHFVLGDLYLDIALKNPEHAEALLPQIETHWLRCLEIGEKPDIDGCVTGRGSTLAAHNLYIFYESLGMAEKSIFYKNLSMR